MSDLPIGSGFDPVRERRLVILADWLPPDFGAVGQYMRPRARSLAERGHDVTLVGLASGNGSILRESVGRSQVIEMRLHGSPVPRASLLARLAWTAWTNLRC